MDSNCLFGLVAVALSISGVASSDLFGIYVHGDRIYRRDLGSFSVNHFDIFLPHRIPFLFALGAASCRLPADSSMLNHKVPAKN